MKILSASQIRDWDNYTIKNEPISSIDLMERASFAFCNWFIEKFSKERLISIFCGPGNNGGDGLAIARILISRGYKVEVYSPYSSKRSNDYLSNEQRLLEFCPVHSIKETIDIPSLCEVVVIDALFGSGLSRPITGIYKDIIDKVNNSNVDIVSVDIASGLYCDTLNEDQTIIKSHHTVTFQSPKLSFLLPQNDKYVGELHVLDIGLIPAFLDKTDSKYYYITQNFIHSIIKKRTKFSHKGTFGTALLMCGSYGMIGAAVLSAKACLRAGVGLCVSYIPKCGYEILQSIVPECMVVVDSEADYITSIPELSNYRAIGVGPGIGKADKTKDALKLLFEQARVPLIIDADALNNISESKELFSLIPKGCILTPHPKEFERLVGKANDDYQRLEKQSELANRLQSVIILKGANTSIAFPDGRIFFNSTGNPGMATGGSGDVLTGIVTSLVAQGYSIEHASVLGVYLHGFAGDVASFKYSQPGMVASDIVEGISEFYKKFN